MIELEGAGAKAITVFGETIRWTETQHLPGGARGSLVAVFADEVFGEVLFELVVAAVNGGAEGGFGG
jgi:hypothetical protein